MVRYSHFSSRDLAQRTVDEQFAAAIPMTNGIAALALLYDWMRSGPPLEPYR